MIKKNLSFLYLIAGYTLFLGVLFAIVMPLYKVNLRNEHLLLLIFITSLMLLPFADYIFTKIKIFSDEASIPIIDIETIDLIISINSLDDFLEDKFNTILHIMGVKNGLLLFYDKEHDKYKTYSHVENEKELINSIKIDENNILFKIINSADDVIVKRKLNYAINFEKNIYKEIKKLAGEVVVPIYYQDMFVGLMVLGERKSRFTNEEIKTLKIFASKIAILTINSFFKNEKIKKKSLEKEHKLAKRIQKKFLPKLEIELHNLNSLMFFNSSYEVGERIHDLFENNRELRITAYGIKKTENSPIILLPAVRVLIQSYARLNYSPVETISKMKETMHTRGIISEELDIMHMSIDSNGKMEFYSENYPIPYIYSLKKLRQKKFSANSQLILNSDALIFICSKHLKILIDDNIILIEDFLNKNSELDLFLIRDNILKLLDISDNDYIFLTLVRFGKK